MLPLLFQQNQVSNKTGGIKSITLVWSSERFGGTAGDARSRAYLDHASESPVTEASWQDAGSGSPIENTATWTKQPGSWDPSGVERLWTWSKFTDLRPGINSYSQNNIEIRLYNFHVLVEIWGIGEYHIDVVGDIITPARLTTDCDGDIKLVGWGTMECDGDIITPARLTSTCAGDIVIETYYHQQGNLLAYWDARQVTRGAQPSQGAGISEWVDHSGNEWHLLAPLAEDEPVFQEAGIPKAGPVPSIEFNADTTRREDFQVANFDPVGTEFTIFAVWMSESSQPSTAFIYNFGEGNTEDILSLTDAINATWMVRDLLTLNRDSWNFGSPAEDDWGKRDTVVVTAHRFKEDADATTQHNQHDLWVNGRKLVSGVDKSNHANEGAKLSNFSTRILWVGAWQTGYFYGHLEGHIALLVWYKEDLGDALIETIIEKLMTEFTNRITCDGDIKVIGQYPITCDGDIRVNVWEYDVGCDGDIELLARIPIECDGDIWIREPTITRGNLEAAADAEWEISGTSSHLDAMAAGDNLPPLFINTSKYSFMDVNTPFLGKFGKVVQFKNEDIPADQKFGTIAKWRWWFSFNTLVQDPLEDQSKLLPMLYISGSEFYQETLDLVPWAPFGIVEKYVEWGKKSGQPNDFFTYDDLYATSTRYYVFGTIAAGSSPGQRIFEVYAWWIELLRFHELDELQLQYPEALYGNNVDPPKWVYAKEIGGDIKVVAQPTKDCIGDIKAVYRRDPGLQCSGDIKIREVAIIPGCPTGTLEEPDIVVSVATDRITVTREVTIVTTLEEPELVVAAETTIVVTLEEPTIAVEICEDDANN